MPFLWFVVHTCLCIWLFSTALSGFDRRQLRVWEIVLRFIAAFALLVINPLIHLPVMAVGISLIFFDWHQARRQPLSH